jgi:valyl-tRNA synthetase
MHSLITTVTDDIENFRLHYVGKRLEEFILNDFSRWYIKLVRDRLSPWYDGGDKRAAQFSVLYVLENLTRLLAPVTPFISEKIYRKLFFSDGRPASVHLCAWPKTDESLVDRKLEGAMDLARSAIEGANSLRQKTGIKLKWPVEELIIKAKDKETEEVLREMDSVLRSMANAEKIVFAGELRQKEKLPFEYGELALGPVLVEKAFARELMRTIQMLRKKDGLNVNERIELYLETDEKTERTIEKSRDSISNEVGAARIHKVLPHKVGVKGELDFEGKKVRIYFEKAVEDKARKK